MKAIVCALASAVMFYLALGINDAWFLTWIAPAPLLWLAYSDEARWRVAAASFFALFVGQAYLFESYSRYIGPPLLAVLAAAPAASVHGFGAVCRSGQASDGRTRCALGLPVRMDGGGIWRSAGLAARELQFDRLQRRLRSAPAAERFAPGSLQHYVFAVHCGQRRSARSARRIASLAGGGSGGNGGFGRPRLRRLAACGAPVCADQGRDPG